MHVLLEAHFKLAIEGVDFLDEIHLHGLLLLHVLVPDLLLLCEEGFVHGLELRFFFFIDGIDHLSKLESLSVVRPGNISFLTVVFFFQNAYITVKLLIETSHATFLQRDKVLYMDKMVSESHLILLFSLIEVTIEHLQNSVLGVDLSVVILLINLNLLLERFGFGQTKPLTPLR